MSNFSDHTPLDRTAEGSFTVLSSSCKIELILHDKTEQPRQNALVLLSQAEAALHQWRRALEAQGVLYGEIHTYPHRGITRYNYYPDAPDAQGKKRRIYVSLENLADYRAEIARGQQCQQIQVMAAQLSTLMQTARGMA